jgi:hypothetical protein
MLHVQIETARYSTNAESLFLSGIHTEKRFPERLANYEIIYWKQVFVITSFETCQNLIEMVGDQYRGKNRIMSKTEGLAITWIESSQMVYRKLTNYRSRNYSIGDEA